MMLMNNIGIPLPTTHVENKTYTAEENMTWADWCVSNYNEDGFVLAPSECVHTDTGHGIVNDADTGDSVLGSQKIKENGIYIIVPFQGGASD